MVAQYFRIFCNGNFAGAVSPQYIRLARPCQPYVVMPPEPLPQFQGYSPYGNQIFRNGNFNPYLSSYGQTAQAFTNPSRYIVCPTLGEYMTNVVFRSPNGVPRDIRSLTEAPFVDPSCAAASYIDSAFNFNWTVKAPMFAVDHCLQINEAPGASGDFIIKGPTSVAEFFPALQNTVFATGVDSAFTATGTNEAYMFKNDIYALFNYARGEIVEGPKRIADRFHSLKDTVFENGIDAAFASHRADEAYLFKGDQYAVISLAPGKTEDCLLSPPRKITDGFPSLRNTVFADGLDAVFQAKDANKAYIFKGDTYALINYAPGTTDGRVFYRVAPITDGFHSMMGVVPRYPCGC